MFITDGSRDPNIKPDDLYFNPFTALNRIDLSFT
jgi:hypothetical protein